VFPKVSAPRACFSRASIRSGIAGRSPAIFPGAIFCSHFSGPSANQRTKSSGPSNSRCSAPNPNAQCLLCRISWGLLEARTGFEPACNGFANRCLTTWLPRRGRRSPGLGPQFRGGEPLMPSLGNQGATRSRQGLRVGRNSRKIGKFIGGLPGLRPGA
jgi:hypothetical protein